MSKFYNRKSSKRLSETKIKTYSRASNAAILKKQDPQCKKNSVASVNSSDECVASVNSSDECVASVNSSCEASGNFNDAFHLLSVFYLLEKLNFKYEVINAQTNHACFFMQDNFMNNFFCCYPEYVCLDVFCKIPKIDYSVVLFIGLDTNGHCELLAIGLIKSGNFQEYSWLCDVFKKYNPSWKNMEFIISDHNVYNREMLIKAFPETLLFVSFLHSMKAFKHELSNLDSFVNNKDMSKALQIFEQMMYATSESAYEELENQLKQMPSPIFSLFQKWYRKKEVWALGLFLESKIFSRAFNTYLLNIRRRVKPIVSTQKSIVNVILQLHSAILKFRKEWFEKLTCMFQTPSLFYSRVHVMERYSKCLTPFASELVYEQLNFSEKWINVQEIDRATYKVNGTVVSFNTCSCNFHTLMMLPCCHMFAVRKFLSLPLFVESLRSSWTATSYQNTWFNLYSALIATKSKTSETTEISKRYQQFTEISHELWNQILNCPEDISQERLDVFQDLLKAWKNSFKTDINVCEKQNDSSHISVEALENTSNDCFKEIYGVSVNDILDSEIEFPYISLTTEDDCDLF